MSQELPVSKHSCAFDADALKQAMQQRFEEGKANVPAFASCCLLDHERAVSADDLPQTLFLVEPLKQSDTTEAVPVFFCEPEQPESHLSRGFNLSARPTAPPAA